MRYPKQAFGMAIKSRKFLRPNHHPARTDQGASLQAILVESGRLDPEDLSRIEHMQRERGVPFGEAALQLGLVKPEDLQFALARQFDFPYLSREASLLSPELIAAFHPNDERVEQLRALRSHLSLRWFNGAPEQKALAIVSPSRSEGRSYLAANLAIVFAQLGERTLLVDADLRHPRQHQLFALDNELGLSAALVGRCSMQDAIVDIHDLTDLYVLPAGTIPPNPQELIARGAFNTRMREMADEFDVILVDTPEIAGIADVQLIAVATGGALMVAKKGVTSVSAVSLATQSLRQVGINVIGSVLIGD